MRSQLFFFNNSRFSYKFGGGNAKMLLELTSEVLGIFEAEEVGGLADAFAVM